MGTNGITALFIHSCLIIVLIIIPIVLNITKKEDVEDGEEKPDHNILNFEERKKLIKTLSLFTIFIWILTSIIAIKF
jgi:predicted nucleic acid-binding Zn ribbon protein